MADCKTIIRSVYSGTSVVVMARLLDSDGNYVEESDISTITCRVFETAAPATNIVTPTVVVADAIYNTLQTDELWNADSTGYNFKHVLPTTAVPSTNKHYVAVYTVTFVNGVVEKLVFQLNTGDV